MFADPFVLSHNLGAALTLSMVKFIRSTFENARERFGTARNDIPSNIQQRQRFFFDPLFLTDGFLPPADRNCNVCGKIGHWGKQCPYNKSKRKNEEQNKTKKSQQDNVEKGQHRQEKGQQNIEQKNTDPKIAEKTPENNMGKDIQMDDKSNSNSSGIGSQNNDKNGPVNLATRIKANSTTKTDEGKQETKKNMEGKN